MMSDSQGIHSPWVDSATQEAATTLECSSPQSPRLGTEGWQVEPWFLSAFVQKGLKSLPRIAYWPECHTDLPDYKRWTFGDR